MSVAARATDELQLDGGNQMPQVLRQGCDIHFHLGLQLGHSGSDGSLDLLLRSGVSSDREEDAEVLEHLVSRAGSAARSLGLVLLSTIQPLILPHPVVDQARNVLEQLLIGGIALVAGGSGLEEVEDEGVHLALLALGPLSGRRNSRSIHLEDLADSLEDSLALGHGVHCVALLVGDDVVLIRLLHFDFDLVEEELSWVGRLDVLREESVGENLIHPSLYTEVLLCVDSALELGVLRIGESDVDGDCFHVDLYVRIG